MRPLCSGWHGLRFHLLVVSSADDEINDLGAKQAHLGKLLGYAFVTTEMPD